MAEGLAACHPPRIPPEARSRHPPYLRTTSTPTAHAFQVQFRASSHLPDLARSCPQPSSNAIGPPSTRFAQWRLARASAREIGGEGDAPLAPPVRGSALRGWPPLPRGHFCPTTSPSGARPWARCRVCRVDGGLGPRASRPPERGTHEGHQCEVERAEAGPQALQQAAGDAPGRPRDDMDPAGEAGGAWALAVVLGRLAWSVMRWQRQTALTGRSWELAACAHGNATSALEVRVPHRPFWIGQRQVMLVSVCHSRRGSSARSRARGWAAACSGTPLPAPRPPRRATSSFPS